jgi:hypothetical protein
MSADMANNGSTRIEISVSRIKNKSQLIQELQSFAGLLWSSVDSSEDAHNTIVLTFKREEAKEFALTLYQLLGVLKQQKNN